MKIFYINSDSGDGSSCTHFYDSQEALDYVMDEDNGFEEYMDGDGGSWGSFEVPDGTPITGIRIRALEEVRRDDYA